MPLCVTLALRSEKGPVRERNEDAVGALEPPHTPPGVGGLYAVADGLGGHQRGEVASALALQVLLEAFRTPGPPPPGQPSGWEELLADVLRQANQKIYALNMATVTGEELHREPERPGMGTTLTAALFAQDALVLGHVGDSRAYLLRGGVLTQLTEDHTLVGEQVRQGLLSLQKAAQHPYRNVLTQAVGTTKEVSPFTRTQPLRPGDRLLLCSDGLSGALDEAALARLLGTTQDPRQAVDALVEAAIAADGHDNTTALAAFFSASDIS